MQTPEKLPEQDFMSSKWRPMMAIMYMIVCTCDFIVFPVLWSLLQALDKGSVTLQWQPLTLQGAGLFHIAMGAVLGVAAWSRGQEKIAGASVTPPSAPVQLTTTQGFNGTSNAPRTLTKPVPQPQQEL